MPTARGDPLIRAGAVHTLVPGQAVQRAVAVRGDRIAAVSAEPNGLDHPVSAETHVHDLNGATVLPAFDDTHTHLIFAALGVHDVPVHQARNIPEFLGLIRQRASPPRASGSAPPPPPIGRNST